MEAMKWSVRSGLKSLLWLVACAGLVVTVTQAHAAGAQAPVSSVQNTALAAAQNVGATAALQAESAGRLGSGQDTGQL